MELQRPNESAALQPSSDGTIALSNPAENMAPPGAPAPTSTRGTRSDSRARSGTRWLRIVAFSLLALIVVLLGAGYGAYARWAKGEHIARGVVVQGEDVGGLTALEARRRLTERFGRLFIEFQTPHRSFKMSLRELGGEPQIQEAVKNAYWFGRSRSVPENVWNVWSVRQNEKRLAVSVRWDKERLRQKMWAVATLYNQKPQDARLEVDEGGVQVISEGAGRTLNVGETLLQLQKRYYVGLPQSKRRCAQRLRV
jgi:hypothetical protein